MLASASPRRSDLLRQVGLSHEVLPAHVDETPGARETPAGHVERLAREKARAVATLLAEKNVEISDLLIREPGTAILTSLLTGKYGSGGKADGRIAKNSWKDGLAGSSAPVLP